MKITVLFVLTLFVVIIFVNVSCSKEEEPVPGPVYGSYTDPRDGHVYSTIQYGNQTWLAENLNYDTASSWIYDDDSRNAEIYGRLYNWETAIKICPQGWHIPTMAEWSMLIDYYLAGADVAGGKLKESGTLHWASPNTGATNESGFTALPGGYRSYFNAFLSLGMEASFWSGSEYDSLTAYKYDLSYDTEAIQTDYDYKRCGRSVRCVKDH